MVKGEIALHQEIQVDSCFFAYEMLPNSLRDLNRAFRSNIVWTFHATVYEQNYLSGSVQAVNRKLKIKKTQS